VQAAFHKVVLYPLVKLVYISVLLMSQLGPERGGGPMVAIFALTIAGLVPTNLALGVVLVSLDFFNHFGRGVQISIIFLLVYLRD
jgi:hypothetical protein